MGACGVTVAHAHRDAAPVRGRDDLLVPGYLPYLDRRDRLRRTALCSGGGGPGCDDEQERIAQEYTDYAVEERDHPACDEIEENGNDATYFSWDELNGFWTDGNPHTNYGWVSQTLKDNLDQLRTNYGEPLALSSGYRCPHGNASIQGASATSWHLEGRAADISVKWLAGVSNDWNGMSAAEQASVRIIWNRLDDLARNLGTRDRQPFTKYADRHYHAAW